MGNLALPQCEYCGSSRVDETGLCEECGNKKREILLTREGPTHKDWYSLEESISAEEAKPKPKPTELPENMKVPTHPDWYDLAGTAGKLPVARKLKPPPPIAKNAIITASILAVVLLMGAMAYLLLKIHQDVPVGFGAHP